jgi:hypothetical protein
VRKDSIVGNIVVEVLGQADRKFGIRASLFVKFKMEVELKLVLLSTQLNRKVALASRQCVDRHRQNGSPDNRPKIN